MFAYQRVKVSLIILFANCTKLTEILCGMWQRRVVDFYISDFQSGLRALVKTGYGARVTPYVDNSIVIDINPAKEEMSQEFLRWLAERNLSSEGCIMRLEEGYKPSLLFTLQGFMVFRKHTSLISFIMRWLPRRFHQNHFQTTTMWCTESQHWLTTKMIFESWFNTCAWVYTWTSWPYQGLIFLQSFRSTAFFNRFLLIPFLLPIFFIKSMRWINNLDLSYVGISRKEAR